MGFELSWFWFWVILAAFLIIGEIFTSGFFLLPFGVGAAVSVLAAWFGLGPIGQWIVFLAVSIPSLFLLKRFAKRVTQKGESIQVASDRAIGKTAPVAHVMATLSPQWDEKWQEGDIFRAPRLQVAATAKFSGRSGGRTRNFASSHG